MDRKIRQAITGRFRTMKIRSIAAAALLAAGVTMVGTTISEAKELRLSMAPPPKSPWGAVAQKFVDKVAELSGGELTIKAYMGSKLGGEQDVVKQIARGRVDMGVMSNSAVSLGSD